MINNMKSKEDIKSKNATNYKNNIKLNNKKSRNNKRILKYMLVNISEFIISIVLSLVTYVVIYYVAYDIYSTYRYPTYNSFFSFLFRINNNIFSGRLYIILGFIIFAMIYMAITYRKFSSLSQIVEELESMSKGQFDNNIEVKSSGDISKVAQNINDIVDKLKNITVEERKAQQTKSDLITNVSHDLRTPLTSIIGYLNLIEEGKYKDEVELMYYIDIAYEKSLNLNVLINDLFDLTKMQNKTIYFNKQNLNLIELIGQLVSQFSIQFEQHNMECRLDFKVDKVMIDADPMMLVRAFENLITNAMRYGSEGHYVDIVVREEENMVVIEFINYGEPIPIVDLQYIFDRFYRVEKSRNTYEGGSGLGLAITKNIIETHNGEISVSSDNNNTTFEVRLPNIL